MKMAAEPYDFREQIKKIFFAVMIALFIPHYIKAEQPCATINTNKLLKSSLASSGFFANLRYSENSIQYQMDLMLEEARTALGAAAQVEEPCDNQCTNPILGVIFSSTPNVTLKDYDEQQKCQELFQQTTAQPIVYRNRVFDDQEAAKEWYNELTQGEGVDGEDLYERCDGSCSPQYSSFIYSLNGRLVITTSIICGHARDKDDGQYQLSSSLEWRCPRS